jgi:hypothetical protein
MAGPLDKNYFTSAFQGGYNAPNVTTGTVYQLDNAGNAYKTVGGPLSETEELLANRRKQRSDDNKQALADQMAKDLANNPNAQYGRAPVPSFIPGAFLVNALTGAGKTEEERKMLMENPGQNKGIANYVFGTGKYEPYHLNDTVSNQGYASGVEGGRKNNEGMGDFNADGLGRNMNYDRFGNERKEIPAGTDMNNTYWNSTTGNWTSKSSGLPVGSVDVDDAKANATRQSSSKQASSGGK